MNLILWRHADAEDGIPDEKRRLTAKGRRQARKMADWLESRLPAGWRVMASPAARTCETAAALTNDFVTDPALSTAATPQGLLKAAGWPDADGTIVVVGHQPTLGAAAGLALTGTPQPWNVKKGAIWWITRDDNDGIMVRAVLAPGIV